MSARMLLVTGLPNASATSLPIPGLAANGDDVPSKLQTRLAMSCAGSTNG